MKIKILYVLLLLNSFLPSGKAQYTKLHDFGVTTETIPYGSLITDGTFLYGMTNSGGTYNKGTIFKIKPDGSGFSKLLDFSGTVNGSTPFGNLISDGTFLYGMTENGGTNTLGTIFKIKPDGTGYFKLLDFSGTTNGRSPHGSLIYDGTFLYGMTAWGGTGGYGTIFKIKPDGTGYFKLLDFLGPNGQCPYGSLIYDGVFLYGMTQNGGISTCSGGCGTIFKIKPDGTGFSKLLDFSGLNGVWPLGSLNTDGTCLYGMTSRGGSFGKGNIFKINYDGTGLTQLLEFSGPNGSNPYGDLNLNGIYLYGMTEYGGTSTSCFGGTQGCGSIFKIKTDGTGYSKLLDFSGTNGSHPTGNLIFDPNYLFGMTKIGGNGNCNGGCGSIFKYDYHCNTIIVPITVTSPVCGNNNGSVSVSPSGGTAPYTFFWSNGNSTSSITGLSGQPADSFTVTITDSQGCSMTDSATVQCTNSGNSQWTNVNFTGNLDVLQDIHFLDANTGFICGYYNGTSNTCNRIYRTTNGGTSWSKVLEITDPTSGTSHSMHSIFFPTPSKGFVVGGKDGTYPFICSTINGGVTWDTLTLYQYTNTIKNVFFPSANVGYICGDVINSQTGLYKTTDGGSTWSDISVAASSSMNGTSISDIHFLDDNNGFASTLPSSGVQAGIYKTTNGGSTWTQVFSIANNEGFKALQFISSTTGFAAATVGKVFKTTNGGSTWTAIPVSTIQSDIWDVHFLSPQIGYAASRDALLSGGIYKTTNGGSSWFLDNSGNFIINTTYYSLSFAGTRGYACGISGYSWRDTTSMSVFEPTTNVLTINIYPNPGNGKFKIKNTVLKLTACRLAIYNVFGDEIHQSIISNPESTFDISSAPSGIYFLRITMQDGSSVVNKIIKE